MGLGFLRGKEGNRVTKPDPKLRKAGVKDVARLSGTSLGTVSRVLNGNASVSAEARAKVEDAIAELGYQPHAGARQMRSGSSRLIGILLPSLDVPFFGILAQALEQRLFAEGYHCLICNTAESEANEMRYVSTLIGQQVDGIIAAAVLSAEHFARLDGMGIPVVAVDRTIGPDVTTIAVDHYAGGRLMAEHLLALGHRQIGVVGAPEQSSPVQERLRGIRDAMSEHGAEEPVVALGEEHNIEACGALAARVLDTCAVTALIGTTDLAAIGAIHAGHAQGLTLPKDLSVIGFDNIPQSAYVFPRLTTVEQPMAALGKAAAEAILNQIAPERFDAPDLDRLSLSVVERDSTAPV